MKKKTIFQDIAVSLFKNPFVSSSYESPFEIIKDEEDQNKEGVKSNLFIDLLIFKLKVVFNSTSIFQENQETGFIDVLLQADEQVLGMLIDKKKKQMQIKNYIPAFVYRFRIFDRKYFKSFSKHEPDILNVDHRKIVDLAGFEIIDSYDEVKINSNSIEELEGLKPIFDKHSEEFKRVFGDPKTYPKIIKESGKSKIVFPDKAVLQWNNKESVNERY